jgi:hypothetical protein
MRLQRRLHQTPNRRPAAPRRRPRLGRGTTLELLERRELLSGAPWQNPLNPRDVNNDLRVSPVDALMVINSLLTMGTHVLQAPAAAPAAAPLAAAPGIGKASYLDVNGDDRVSPVDLLMVVNELQDVELLRVETFPTDLAGNPISTIAAGEQFKLQAVATDIRDPLAQLPGVFAAAADVSFNTAFSSIDTGQVVDFDPFFGLVKQASLSQGRIIAYVSTGDLNPPGNDPQPLWSVILTATGSGTQVFVPGFSTDTFHENLLYGLNDPLPADEILYVGSILEVTGSALFIDDVAQAEDSGAPFNFTVSLSSPTTEVVTVRFATSNDSASAGSDYVATTGTLTFNAGETMMTVPVTVNPDLNIEPDETFVVTLSNATGNVNIGKATGIGTILNDDLPPSLSIDDVTVTAATMDTTATFFVTLTGLIDEPVSVGFATADDSAIAGVDYLANTGNLTFTPGGPTTLPINVIVLASTGPKPDRSFFVNLSSSSDPDVVIEDGSGVGTIVTQGLSISDATVVEGNAGMTAAVFTVTLSRMTVENVTVAFQTADDTATAGEDYVAASGTLTFTPAGAQTQLISVLVNGDTDIEGNERFAVNLSNADGAPLFNSQGIGTILNDDGQKMAIRLEVVDSSGTPLAANDALDVGEEFELRVFVTDIQADPGGVASAFMDIMYQSNLVMPLGTITYGSFYTFVQSARFEPGLLDDFGAFGQLAAPPDPAAELLLFRVPFEALAVGLVTFDASVDSLDSNHDVGLYGTDDPLNPSEVNIEDRSANIGRNVIVVDSVSAPESSNLVFSVTRFLPDDTLATVVFATADGTATAGLDYVAQSGMLTFAAGASPPQMITVVVNNDTTDEPDETMLIQLSGAVGATAGSPGTGTILDDDGEVTLSVGNASAAEGAGLVFTASLSAASGKTVTVAFNTNDGSAIAGLDYTSLSGMLTFEPGVTQQTVTVESLGDILFEADENFQLVLSAPVNALLGVAAGQGTIIDVPPAGISGFVYVDLNNNAIKEAGETGIPGAIVTATRPSDGFTQSTMTGADGSYLLTGLLPGVYTLAETQPGFYTDGRDRRAGAAADSPVNDRFTGIELVPSAAETGFNFGEQGIRAEFISAFINRRALFATAAVGGTFGPTLNMAASTLNLKTGDIWVSFDGGWSGLRTIEALFDSSQGSVTMKLYNNALQEVAIAGPTATGAVLLYSGQTGQPYFLRLSGTNPNVTVQMLDAVVPANVAAPSAAPSTASDPPPAASASTATAAETPGKFASSAQPMTAPLIEPLVSSDASDEALGEDEDWVLDALLA